MVWKISFSFLDPQTNNKREPKFNPPIALGSNLKVMQERITEKLPCLVIADNRISSYHALIEVENNQVVITDQNSTNGTVINGIRQQKTVLRDGDIVKVGGVEITINIFDDGSSQGTKTILIDPPPPPPPPSFPLPQFMNGVQLSENDLRQWCHQGGYSLIEKDYIALGGGLGSYIWVDLLRIWGVNANRIMAIGLQENPYTRYQQLCLNSQIPPYERLRSNSDSCPDNIWAFPSYAWREAWHNLTQGNMGKVIGYLWQVFSEPDLSETYTPKSQNVFDSIDRETKRINWEQIYQYGSIRAIRKTDQGRYAIAYSKGKGNYGFALGTYTHLALGYPGIRLLKDLAEYRQKTKDEKSVVNAYEPNDHVYETLAQNGGKVIIRGRGIVASRIIQRIYETIQKTGRKDISILHLMRSEITQGHKYGMSKRLTKYNQELQPFNWPKACWGGDLRLVLEKASDPERKKLLDQWGGTTTADRKDWQKMIEKGLKEKWYQMRFGKVIEVEKNPHGDGTITSFEDLELNGITKLEARFIIDATGLEAKIQELPLIYDLQKTYNLDLNSSERLAVTNDFEIKKMSNGRGKMYASGVMTLGGPYAAVDSFLGLQYCALCAVDSLTHLKAPELKYLNGISSLIQWWKWVVNQSP
jgi:pSer/pThr/pTyr-binding forkhead associated (FHA) protein